MNGDETEEELYSAELPHVLRQRDVGFCSERRHELGFCGGGTSNAAARALQNHFSSIPHALTPLHHVSPAYAPKRSSLLLLSALARRSERLITLFFMEFLCPHLQR
jgi:hypothetical protein